MCSGWSSSPRPRIHGLLHCPPLWGSGMDSPKNPPPSPVSALEPKPVAGVKPRPSPTWMLSLWACGVPPVHTPCLSFPTHWAGAAAQPCSLNPRYPIPRGWLFLPLPLYLTLEPWDVEQRLLPRLERATKSQGRHPAFHYIPTLAWGCVFRCHPPCHAWEEDFLRAPAGSSASQIASELAKLGERPGGGSWEQWSCWRQWGESWARSARGLGVDGGGWHRSSALPGLCTYIRAATRLL